MCLIHHICLLLFRPAVLRVKMTFPTFILDVNKFNSSLFTVVGTTITPLADSTVVQGTLNGYSHI